MSRGDVPGVGGLPVLLAYHINRLCDGLEAAWRAGRRPRIEAVLELEAEPGQTALLRELLAVELAARRQRGERPDSREYRDRFPGDTAVIDAVFAEVEVPRADGGKPELTGVHRVSVGDETVHIPTHDDPIQPAGAQADTENPAASARVTDSTGRRYRILRPHLRGGLGEVFVAFDEELRREVALKAIRPEHAGLPRNQARFLLEAEITGRLEHPGIVPVYGLDRHADGRPYYAMRFVQGHTLKEAIAHFHGAEGPHRDTGERTLALRQLLRRFIDVCNAMAYAHTRGVLHRDLKPANILLGPFGETLIVDWGLAKAIDGPDGGGGPSVAALRPSLAGDSTLTQTGSALGTPGYMSPEQAAGQWDRLGPPSDVYSLGATLYGILTGRSPIDARDVDEALQKARDGDFPPPRQVRREVDAALEAICLRAMALDPADRYPSALALAEDLEHWLADEPVSACREPLSQRARRWGRRHRTAVSAAAVAVLAGVIGLGAVAAVEARSNTALRGAKTATDQALAETRREKDKAEESLAQSEAVRTLLVEVFRSPDPWQDGKDIKVADALDRAAKRLDREFRGSEATRGALLDALGTTYLGLGLYDRAVDLLTRARAVREAALGTNHPDALSSRNNLANAYGDAGRPREAIALHEATLELRETTLGPDHPDTVSSRNNLASAYRDAGRLDEAITLFKEVLELREAKLGRDHLKTLTSRNNLANAYRDAGHLDEAIALHEATLELREAKLGPDHPDTLRSRNNLAITYQHAGRTADAIAIYKATLELSESKMDRDHPETLDILINLGAAYYDAGRMLDAIALNEGTLKRLESKLGPDHFVTLGTRGNLAAAYLEVGRMADAIAMFETVLERTESARGPDDPQVLLSRVNLAEAYLAAGRLSRALPLSETTLKLLEVKRGFDNPDTLAGRNNLAEAYLAAGRLSDALGMHRATLEQRESKLGPDHPDTLSSRNNLARAYDALGRWAEAGALRRDTLARRRKTEKSDSPLLAGDLAGLGRNLLEQQRWSEAESLLRESLTIRRRAMPDDWRTFAVMSLLGGSLSGQGRYPEAEPLVMAGYEGMKGREASIPAPSRGDLDEAAGRVVRLFEACSRPDRAVAWKIKLGLTDLPAEVFAPAHGR